MKLKYGCLKIPLSHATLQYWVCHNPTDSRNNDNHFVCFSEIVRRIK